jgi:hypothetical protein
MEVVSVARDATGWRNRATHHQLTYLKAALNHAWAIASGLQETTERGQMCAYGWGRCNKLRSCALCEGTRRFSSTDG